VAADEVLSQSALARVVADWDALMGAGGALAAGRSSVVQRRTDTAESRGGVSCVRLGNCLVVSLPSGVDAARFHDALSDLPADFCDEASGLVVFFDAVEVLGPARLRFRDQVPAHVPQAEVRWGAAERHREELRSVCSESDLGESGLPEPGQEAAVILIDGRAVAASWWDPWQESLAHVAVLVAPNWRGRGLATDVASVATADAIGHGRVAQWRVRPAITASVATARRLGFVDLGYQLTLRLRDHK
jgi:RimJ/RimL family protein N-acetyltransferase